MRGTVRFRQGAMLGIETEGYDYSIMELTGEHADIDDTITWEGFGSSANCINETRRTSFQAYFQDHGVNPTEIQRRLSAFRQ